MAKAIMTIDVREIIERTQAMRDTIERGAAAVCKKVATDAESDMRTNAPWTDRTANARNGLTGRDVIDKSTHQYSVVLFHTMPYGIFLETRNSGKYAIILPTLQRHGPRTMNLLKQILNGAST